MKYHVELETGGILEHFWNNPKQTVVTEFLIPFIHGQVVTTTSSGRMTILNMKSVRKLTVYQSKTSVKLRQPANENPMSQYSGDVRECTKEILRDAQLVSVPSAAQSLLQRATAPLKQQVFVIMKFGVKELDSAYEGVIKPVIEENGLRAIRIDEVQDSGRINDQILDSIAVSRYVVADLTGERPNCYYECGFAHALGKELILTVQNTGSVHFDLAAYRFIEWSTESELRRGLRTRFAALKERAT